MSITDLKEFHDKFKIPRNKKPGFLTKDMMKMRLNFMLEELIETAEASGFTLVMGCGSQLELFGEPEFRCHSGTRNLEMTLDGLIDLVYVAIGTADLMGMSRTGDSKEKWKSIWIAAWDRVHKANMQKVRAKTVSQSKRKSKLDVVKPQGWQKPTFTDLLT